LLTIYYNGVTIVIDTNLVLKEKYIVFLKKIAPTRAYQAVVSQLEDAILSGNLKSGERLPSERELIDVFATSRRTLREAFRVLEQKGLIEIKLGSKGGTFVANHVGEKLVETLSLFIRSESISGKDLAEFRAVTEGEVAELVARRVNQEGLDLVKKSVLDLEEISGNKRIDKLLFVEKEMALHQLLADICGNAMYAPIVKTVYDYLLRDAFLTDHIDGEYVENAIRDWKHILDALESKSAKKAGELMRKHILGFAGQKKNEGESE
jgi:GntR family transcriptional repressor for pyruvate dehydrogenase complex